MLRAACILALLLVLSTATAAAEPAFPTYDDNGEALTIALFVERYIPEDMPEGLGRTEVLAALEDAGANWIELAQALKSIDEFWASHRVYPLYPLPRSTAQHDAFIEQENAYIAYLESVPLADLVWLIVSAPHLDRLELTSDVLLRRIWEANRSRDEVPEATWRRYVLNYRFDDEPVTDWAFLSHWMEPDATTNNFSLARHDVAYVLDRFASGFSILERGYFGNQSDPLSLLQSRTGTARELAILVGAALRSQGYATRFVREGRSGESWLEVYTGDVREYDPHAWTPVYPTAPERSGDVGYATELCGGRITVVTAGDAFGREQVTDRYADTAQVALQFIRATAEGRQYDNDFSGFAITAWNHKTGSYAPLDDLSHPAAAKDYPLDNRESDTQGHYFTLGPGEYRLECGVRYPGGITHVQTRTFSLSARDAQIIEGSLDPPADLPAAAMVERHIDTQRWQAVERPRRVVLLYRDDGEPSVRAAELLEHYGDPGDGVELIQLRARDEEQRVLVQETLLIEPDDPLPVVIVVVDGQTRLYLRGYNLNIAQWVERALEDNPREPEAQR